MRELCVNYAWARVCDEHLEPPGALTGATGSADGEGEEGEGGGGGQKVKPKKLKNTAAAVV